MSGGADSKPDAEIEVHHLDDAGSYLQVWQFSKFQTILLNCVTNDFF
jgi:hypothetical protein